MAENRPTMRDETAQSRYRRISTKMWNDRRIRELGHPPPHPTTLFFYLLTNPATTGLPGLFRAREMAMAEDLHWPLKAFRACFGQLEAAGMAVADWDAGLVWLPNAVKHDPPAAPNVVLSWAKIVRNELPECALLLRAVTRLRETLTELFENSESFLKAFDKGFPDAFLKALRNAFPEGIPNALGDPRSRTPDPDTGYRTPPPEAAAGESGPDAAWAFIQRERAERGLLPEVTPPPNFDGWVRDAEAEVGTEGVSRAVIRYLGDAHFEPKGWPTSVLIMPNVWRTRAAGPPRPGRDPLTGAARGVA